MVFHEREFQWAMLLIPQRAKKLISGLVIEIHFKNNIVESMALLFVKGAVDNYSNRFQKQIMPVKKAYDFQR